ncbi:hypothetical protein HMPREF1977_1972 [Capnocytophaga ochracea F0287]|uniref:Uncharacterized protein n=1 Tax=Capnocytophaga ochracea F0287 TaxID=873517 RepID=E4MUB2_CAPOC|nr:hypothetical protein HMPREF1977_1972 [Capnocytophaga ochracea F0287]
MKRRTKDEGKTNDERRKAECEAEIRWECSAAKEFLEIVL